MSSFALLLLHCAVRLNLLITVDQLQGFPVKVVGNHCLLDNL